MKDFFDFYGIPIAFFPDEQAIRQKYYANSRLFHPDFYTLENEAVQEEMLEKSSLNNKAYATLSSLENRIPYILSLFSEVAVERALDPSFLMDMMEFNENWEDAAAANDLPAMENLKLECTNRLHTLDEEIKPILEAFDREGANESLINEIQDYYYKRKYILRIQENISTFAGL